MKKYIYSLILTLGILFSFAMAADASTSSSVAYVEYLNQTEGLYANDITIPSVTDSNQDNVNIATGDLVIKETDIYLPGKNGLDLEIVRSFNSGELEYTYYYDGYVLDELEFSGYIYKYLSSDGIERWFYFNSEEQMLSYASETFYLCVDCMRDNRYTPTVDGIDSMYKYVKNCSSTHENRLLHTKIPHEYHVTESKSTISDDTINTKYRMGKSSVVARNRIFKTWRLNTPSYRRELVGADGNDYYTHVTSYVEFYDGESIYPMELFVTTKKSTDEKTGRLTPEYGKKYTGVYDITDSLADHIVGAENRADYLYFESSDGIRFYFNKTNWDFVGKIDRYGNTILYDEDTKTYTDTYGRKITADDDGITINDGLTTKQVVKYENEKIPYTADTSVQTLTPYKFHVKKYGVLDNASTVEKTTYDMYVKERVFMNQFAINYYIIDKIEYPTEARTIYEYTKTQQDDPMRDDPNTYYVSRHNVTKSYFKDGTVISNVKEYIYPENYDETNYDGYTVTVKRDLDNEEDIYTFTRSNKITSIQRKGDSKIIKYTYASNIHYTVSPVSTVTEKYDYTNYYDKKREQSFTYDYRGRLLTETDGKDSKTYTYSTDGILLTATYKRDADTTVVVTNTLSEDKKSIVRSETKENDVLKQIRTYEYDSFGNVTKETVLSPDETESIVNTYSYTYNTNGTSSVTSTVKNLKDADGNTLSDITSTTNFDLFGNVSSVTDGRGNTTSYTYDGRNRLLSETKGVNITTLYSYDAENNIVILTQPNGTDIKYEYDGFGKLEKISVNSGSGYVLASSYTYDGLSRLLTETEYRTYNGSGTCTERYTTTYEYDKFDRETKRTTKGILNNVVYESTTEYNYKASNTYNTITQTVTGDDNITPAVYVANYDVRGVLKNEQLLNGGTEYLRTEYTYDYLDNILTVKDNHAIDNNLDYTVKYEYDYMNNVVKETDITGSFKTTEYDAFGRAVKVTDFGGKSVINYEYDTAGRVIKTTSPADPHLGLDALTKNYYDANGNLVKILTFAMGNSYQVTENEYDSFNRLTKVKTYADLAPNGDTTNLTADIIQYTYDSMDNVLTMSIGAENPSVTTYAYNGLGQLMSKTDALNKAETYTYNLAGQLLSKTDRNGTTFTYIYNVWGSPLSINAVKGEETESISYTYDILGNRLSMTDKWGTTTYTNDFLGRTTQESRTDFRGTIVNQYTYDKFGNVTQASINGQVINNTFDNLNRLTAQTTGTLSSSFSYNSLNKIASKTLNGITSSYGYNDMGLVSSQNTVDSTGKRYFTQSYLYDVRSNIYDITTQTVNSSDNIYYSYDGKNRLKNENGIMAENRYDSKDNRVNRQGDFIPVETDKTFDLNNRDTSCTYDDNGNMTEDEDGVTYTYDLFNRMTQRYAGLGVLYVYSYDGDGRRIRKQDITTDVYFIWDGMNLAEEQEYHLGELQGTKKFIYGVGLSYCITDDDVWTYYTNLRGDIAGYVDSEGNAVEYQYDAWGVLQNPTEGDENPFRYAGEYYDEESGFIYLRNRYYDPSEARFTQEDPIQDGLNWYAYCGNNPVMFVDPSGLYDRKAAVDYALKYGEVSWYEIYQIRFDQDCTNFASHVLLAGGIKENNKWYMGYVVMVFNKVVSRFSDYSLTWSVAHEQYKWISNPNNGYISGNIITVDNTANIEKTVKDNNIQKGDLMYWDFENDGNIDHASVIVSTENGDITYAQHTDDRIDGSLENALYRYENAHIYIVRIKDNAR